MNFATLILLACAGSVHGACSSPGTLTCSKTDSAPTLDAKLDEWASVTGGIETEMHQAQTVTKYGGGTSSYKCLYDDTNIYLSMEIPGNYRFNSTDNKMCAAIGTMMKIGADATFVNMGGCPVACTDGVADACKPYVVDLGAHWELKTTEQNVKYDLNVDNAGNDADNAPGNDLVANKDDEYSASPFCRFDDDDDDAGNEWSGAWAHSNPTDGASGKYVFELSRLLTTKSTVSDTQIVAGKTYEFGIAYWDPNESEATGWTDAGHYTTGCGTEWIDLVLTSGSFRASFAAPLLAGMSLLVGFMMA